MRRLAAFAAAGLVLALGAVAFANAASSRSAPTPQDRKIAALQKQVAALTSQVKTLRLELVANYVGDACLAATTADTFQSTWQAGDQLSQETAQHATFVTDDPPPSAVSDRGACGVARVTRTPGQVPPRITAFGALIAWMLD